MIERTLHQKIDQEFDYDQTLLRPTIGISKLEAKNAWRRKVRRYVLHFRMNHHRAQPQALPRAAEDRATDHAKQAKLAGPAARKRSAGRQGATRTNRRLGRLQ